MFNNKELVKVGNFIAISDLTVSPFPHVILLFFVYVITPQRGIYPIYNHRALGYIPFIILL